MIKKPSKVKNKFYYQLLIAFRGTNYFGWQIQKGAKHITVQGEFNKACEQIFKSKNIKSIGSGRTDTGVHSLGHVVKLEAPLEIAPENLVKGLNSLLPKDIRVLEAQFCHSNFLPTNDAKRKTYRYLFTNKAFSNPFHVGLIAEYNYELDFDLMQRACDLFIGKHDFSDFQCVGSEVATTIREIYQCKLYFQQVNQMHGIFKDHWVFEVEGSGFLKQMVRLMVGTLWNIGRGKTSLDQLQQSLKNPSGKKLGPVASASGLYKISVEYEL